MLLPSWYRTLHEAIQHLPDKQYGRIMRLVSAYALDDVTPAPETLSSVERIVFSLIKPQIDATGKGVEEKEKPAEIETQKKAGAPLGNTNAKKQSKTTVVFPETTEKQPETTHKTTDNNNNNNNNNDHDSLNSKNNDLIDSPKNQSNQSIESTKLLLKTIRDESAKLGFKIDDKKTETILNSGVDPQWFQGPHSILELMAMCVKKQYKNKDKTEADFCSLYPTAINWQTVREDYPAWREQALAQDETDARQKARDAPPHRCECGESLDIHGHCHACGKIREFNNAQGCYIFVQTPAFKIPEGVLLKIIQKRESPETVLSEVSHEYQTAQ
ncbi:MAG: DUF6291 domain-containing protein [Treponema sp.]|jgi:hypothetical protein|nr:DUF6291 domain-containing protein [Treponema sp.]